MAGAPETRDDQEELLEENPDPFCLSDFEYLPNEVVLHMLPYLSFEDRKQFSEVNTRYKELVNHGPWPTRLVLWLNCLRNAASECHAILAASRRTYRSVFLLLESDPQRHGLQILSRFTDTIRNLTIFAETERCVFQVTYDYLRQLLESLSNLVELKIERKMQLSGCGDLVLFDFPVMPHLQTLFMRNFPKIEDSFIDWGHIAPNLKRIEIHLTNRSENFLGSLRGIEKQLTHVGFDCETDFLPFTALEGNNFPNVRKLSVQCTVSEAVHKGDYIQEKACAANFFRWKVPQMTDLFLGHVVAPHVVIPIVQYCQKLTRLTLSVVQGIEPGVSVHMINCLSNLAQLEYLRIEDPSIGQNLILLECHIDEDKFPQLRHLCLVTSTFDDTEPLFASINYRFPNLEIFELAAIPGGIGQHQHNFLSFRNMCERLESLKRFTFASPTEPIHWNWFYWLKTLRTISELRLQVNTSFIGNRYNPAYSQFENVRKIVLDIREYTIHAKLSPDKASEVYSSLLSLLQRIHTRLFPRLETIVLPDTVVLDRNERRLLQGELLPIKLIFQRNLQIIEPHVGFFARKWHSVYS